jgi:hypothetical protein
MELIGNGEFAMYTKLCFESQHTVQFCNTNIEAGEKNVRKVSAGKRCEGGR